jgi:hypothetical protein
MSFGEPTSEGNTQDIEERGKRLFELSEAPIESPDCIAYHGTSLETIRYLLTRGALPGSTSTRFASDPRNPQLGDIYFYPGEHFPHSQVHTPIKYPQIDNSSAISDAEWHANTIAHGDRVCDLLGISRTDYSFSAACYVEGDPEGDGALITTLGIPEEKIEKAVSLARNRKGVLLGLDRSVFDAFPITPGDHGADFRVSTGSKGLAIQYLAAVKPLGPEEEAFFNDLRK